MKLILCCKHSAEFPADKVHSLESNQHLDVEADSVVSTQ